MLFFCLVILSPLQGQHFNYETLKQNLEKVKSDREKLDLLLQLSAVGRAFEPEVADKYAEEAIQIAQKLGDVSSEVMARLELARTYFTLDQTTKSIRELKDAEGLFNSTNLPDEQLETYMLLSKLYHKQKRNKKALEYQELATALRDSMMQEQAVETAEVLKGLKGDAIQAQKGTATVMSQLQKQRENLLRKEAEIAKLEMKTAEMAQERAELERQKALSEMEAAKKELELNETQARQNIFIGIGLLALLLLFGVWQRYHYLQQRRQARFEQERAGQLAQIDKLKDQFLANTSHELRTPLNGIIGLAEALYDRAEELPLAERRDNLGMIISSGKRLSSLVDDILDFARLRTSELSLNLKAVGIKSLVDIVLKFNQTNVRGKELELINEIPQDFTAVNGDENRLQQILHNLIGNAIKFTPTGSIRVTGEVKDKMAVICVADTGSGIPQEKQANIFEEFVQADGAIDRSSSGTGLGLAISKSLIELHRGKIWFESEEGKGSKFYFSVPVSTEKPEAANEKTTEMISRLHEISGKEMSMPAPLQIPFNGKAKVSILIVDDEPINLQVLQHHLAGGGFDITPAVNGEDAMKVIESGKHFDMVLLDIMMPRMSGYEVCQQIREKYLPSELPVIMITAKNQVRDLVEGLAFGANDYISKPFSKQEFLARVQTHLNLSKINAASGRFVPREFLRNLGHETILDVKLGDEVEREVTVFFSDIRDYTTMSEGMTPKQNFGFLNAYLGRIGPLIQNHHGFINQFMGDGIMALFLQSADDAIKASIAMQRTLLDYNVERSAKNRRSIRVGMGMHTGPLVMGIIGDDLRLDATVVSDTVNTASRMEGLTKYYGANILVSGATLASLKDPMAFSHRYLGKIQVKGKKTAIGVYEFFDGENDRIRELKLKTQEEFENGLRAFYNKSFAEALEAFTYVLSQNPDDSPALQYKIKSQEFLQTGVPNDWDGVERMLIK